MERSDGEEWQKEEASYTDGRRLKNKRPQQERKEEERKEEWKKGKTRLLHGGGEKRKGRKKGWAGQAEGGRCKARCEEWTVTPEEGPPRHRLIITCTKIDVRRLWPFITACHSNLLSKRRYTLIIDGRLAGRRERKEKNMLLWRLTWNNVTVKETYWRLENVLCMESKCLLRHGML